MNRASDRHLCLWCQKAPGIECANQLFELPPFMVAPIAIWDELEADLDRNAVPDGPALWQKVRNNSYLKPTLFTREEIYLIYSMLGMNEPNLPCKRLV